MGATPADTGLTPSLRPDLDPAAKAEWLSVWDQAPDISDPNGKSSYLTAIYTQTHTELREKERSQQQLVTWSLTILTGGIGLLGLATHGVKGPLVPILVATLVVAATAILTLGLNSLADDRTRIAQNIDRMHRVMGAFTKGYYYQHSTLLDPAWYGWGFDERKVSNRMLIRKLIGLIWALALLDVLIILCVALSV
jgi:hypothetical protein